MSRHRMVTLAVTTIVLLTGVSMYAAVSTNGWSATLLAPTALRTNAPQRLVNDAMWGVYKDLRLQHFTTAEGVIRFGDGTSTDTTFEQSIRRSGDFVSRHMSFNDPNGNRIDIRSYHTPDMNTLIVWEYEGDTDAQDISVSLQKQFAKDGVRLN